MNDKNKNLIYCNTVYQLIFSINLVKQFSNEKFDIILTDKTDFSKVYENLRIENIFENVYLLNTKSEINKNFINEIKWLVELMTYSRKKYNVKYMIDVSAYKSLYVANLADTSVILLYSLMQYENPNLSVIEIEDGFGTYIHPHRIREYKKAEILLKIVGKKLLKESSISYSLLFYPELCMNNDNIEKRKIQYIDPNNIRFSELLHRVFNITKSVVSKKFIILEESFKADGLQNNIDDIITTIVDYVGVDNVILKTHPRNGRNFYSERNIEILDAPIPWEAMISNENLDDHVLITCASGSAISTKLIYNNKCKVFFLYKLIKGELPHIFYNRGELFFDKIKEKFPGDIYIPTDNEQLFNLIGGLK